MEDKIIQPEQLLRAAIYARAPRSLVRRVSVSVVRNCVHRRASRNIREDSSLATRDVPKSRL